MYDATPHTGHDILSRWNASGVISGVVTQNVDGLHQRSQRRIDAQLGSDTTLERVVALHGSMDEIECLVCGVKEPREAFGRRLHEANRGVARSEERRVGEEWRCGWAARTRRGDGTYGRCVT